MLPYAHPVRDITDTIIENAGEVVRRARQEIPNDYLDALRYQRDDSLQTPLGDMAPVATIPVALVDKWFAEGFNIYNPNVSTRDIVARLKREGRDVFLTTKRAV